MSVRLDHGKDELEDIHEINVTPFIDVILVLLIIFMIAAPLATVDVNVNLPGLTADPQKRPDNQPPPLRQAQDYLMGTRLPLRRTPSQFAAGIATTGREAGRTASPHPRLHGVVVVAFDVPVVVGGAVTVTVWVSVTVVGGAVSVWVTVVGGPVIVIGDPVSTTVEAASGTPLLEVDAGCR